MLFVYFTNCLKFGSSHCFFSNSPNYMEILWKGGCFLLLVKNWEKARGKSYCLQCESFIVVIAWSDKLFGHGRSGLGGCCFQLLVLSSSVIRLACFAVLLKSSMLIVCLHVTEPEEKLMRWVRGKKWAAVNSSILPELCDRKSGCALEIVSNN